MNRYITDVMGDEKDTQLSQAQEFEAADNLPDRFKSVSEPSATPIVDPAYTSISGIVNAYC